MSEKLRIVVGCDDAGYEYKEALKADLQATAWSPRSPTSASTPTGTPPTREIAIAAAETVAAATPTGRCSSAAPASAWRSPPTRSRGSAPSPPTTASPWNARSSQQRPGADASGSVSSAWNWRAGSPRVAHVPLRRLLAPRAAKVAADERLRERARGRVMTAPVLLGVSLKMYFGHRETLNWSRKIVQLADQHPAVTERRSPPVRPPRLPGDRARGRRPRAQRRRRRRAGHIHGGRRRLHGRGLRAELKEIGCRYAEVGHAERRRLFGEGDTVVAAKTAAALRNGLTPVLCVGELDPVEPEEAAPPHSRRGRAPADGMRGKVVLATNPSGPSARPSPPPPSTSPRCARRWGSG